MKAKCRYCGKVEELGIDGLCNDCAEAKYAMEG